MSLPEKGSLLTEAQLDDAVHAVQLDALRKGHIPIAAIISRVVAGGLHEVLGFGHNHLAEGIPGVHGETGALIGLGRREGGYEDLVATSSLSPCEFCQRTMAQHLGIRAIRILDAVNYTPDFASYPPSLKPVIANHAKTVEVFRGWVNDRRNALLWERDIGIYEPAHAGPFDLRTVPSRLVEALGIAHEHAREAGRHEEAPIGAVILDAAGLVIGAGHSRVRAGNDPTLTAGMAAWRAAGGREHWKDKTLVLTAGPDHIGYAMFKVFNFGQLVVASDRVFAGTVGAVRGLGRPVHVMNDGESDIALQGWMGRTAAAVRGEYLGVM